MLAIEPQIIWNHFYRLNQVPRSSKKEERVIQFIIEFAEKLGLAYKKDQVGNVVIFKSATPGFENKKTVVLQSHLDMVHQKNNDVDFNFDTDAIQMYVEGDWVKAKGTTLGADNGIGASIAMSVLASNDVSHGPIAALFTIDEETGMTGAFNLQPDFLTGDILFNLDSEDEGEIYISCAGGIDSNIYFEYKPETKAPGFKNFIFTVKGLKGGHSGMDIVLGRGNANKILARFFWKSYMRFAIQIHSMQGGTARNAIPREANCIFTISNDMLNNFKAHIKQLFTEIKEELKLKEPDFEISLEEYHESISEVFPPDFQQKIMAALNAAPNGVMRMSDEVEGLVETSTNLSKINFGSGKGEINMLTRSSIDAAKNYITNTITAVFELAGASKIDHTGSYPGWKPNPKSEILKIASDVHQKVMGYSPAIKAVHAGLECGIIGKVYPNMEMISFGPNIRNAHSPDEKVQISSVAKFWNYFKAVLEAVPNR
jgi:dipeptidase D